MARRQRAAEPGDPIFAAEMAAATRARHEAFVGDFPERWSKRLEEGFEPDPSTLPGTLHRHDDGCWSNPTPRLHDVSTTAGMVRVLGRYCTVTRTVVAEKKP